MSRIDHLFEKMLELGGSDLHLEQGQPPKLRLHGNVVEIEGEDTLTSDVMKEYLSEICTDREWERYSHHGDLDFAYAMRDIGRFRANYFRQFNGYGAIFRTIPTKILSLEQLKSPEVFKSFARIRSGLVLVTGPTGSGKSTTLAAIIDYINSEHTKKVITIEEPVEFVHPVKNCLISHREVGEDTESFASGLRTALKSDVNVVLVGEMRDMETIELALVAAEMGILVFGTLHTNSAAKTIDRIVDVFPAKKKEQVRSSLASTLKGVVSQQLLRTKDGQGRVASFEILLDNPSLASIIRSGDTNKLISMIQTNRNAGMVTMDDYLDDLVKSDVISLEEAYLKALDKGRFER